MPLRSLFPSLVGLAFVGLSLTLRAAPPTPVFPASGVTLAHNGPTLRWQAEPADAFEVYLNGRKVETLAGDAREYTPFPLAYGEHRWKVVAVRGGQSEASPEQTLKIEDGPLGHLPPGARLLRQGWWVQSSLTVGSDGAALTRGPVASEGWASTSVPATALSALVRNGVYPNPLFGLNALRIPDMHDGFNEEYQLLRYSHIPGKNPWSAPYWFRTTFTLPAEWQGQQLWLTLGEINYKADVWLNGQRIASADTVAGMERAFRLNISATAKPGAENFLAVAIHPLDHPGKPERPPAFKPLDEPGNNMGPDGLISKNYTKWDAIGWDWQPEIRDRDIGITEDVWVEATGKLEVREGYAGSEIDAADFSVAKLHVSAVVANHGESAQTAQAGLIIRDADGREVVRVAELPVTVAASSSVEVPFPVMVIKNPRLWWPYGMGEQHLYEVTTTVSQQGQELSRQVFRFGVRHLATDLDPRTASRIFRVNGQRVYGQGGNWVIDSMLGWTASRYAEEIKLARHARLNFLRVWGPTGAPPSAFYDAADREGMLIQQDFLHDFWGTFRNTPGYEAPEDLVRHASTAMIKRYRNHPSLFVWCGGNEGPNPREAMIKGELLPKHDPWGQRYYLLGSDRDGLKGGGPYHTMPPAAYFGHGKLSQFNSEIGPSGVPEFESIMKFLEVPTKDWAPGRFPLDAAWSYHDANDHQDDDRKFSHYDNLLRGSYGDLSSEGVAGVLEYSRKAQMVNYDVYRASLESLNKDLWKLNTGFALWKFNSSWPSMIWQVFDWYLQPHAGLYAVRKALSPRHVQLNLDDHTVTLVNRTNEPGKNWMVYAERYNLKGQKVESYENRCAEIPAQGTGHIPYQYIPWEEPTLLRLTLKDDRGRVLSVNHYWNAQRHNLKAVANLAPVSLAVVSADQRGQRLVVTLENTAAVPAALVRLQAVDPVSGQEVLPTYWSDNYLQFVPGEKVTLEAELPAGWSGPLALRVSGVNVPVSVTPFTVQR